MEPTPFSKFFDRRDGMESIEDTAQHLQVSQFVSHSVRQSTTLWSENLLAIRLIVLAAHFFPILGFGPFSALYFVCYERFKACSKEFAHTESLSLPYLISSSALAGAVASFVTSPLDLAKLRLHVQRRNNNNRNDIHGNPTDRANPSHNRTTAPVEKHYQGMVDCLRHAYRRGGMPGLFRGAGARVLHYVPATSKS